MEYRDEDRTADETIGRADGENNIPSVNTHTCVFQDTLFHNAIADLISYNNKRRSYIRALNQKREI
jgi:hypothetical protein